MSSLLRFRATLAVSLALLLGACDKPPSAEEVASAFVLAYFVRSDVATAVKLTTGRARANLTAILQEIEASGAREPAKDEPRVKATLIEKLPGSASAVEIVYRVESDVTGIMPITATLRLTREGDEWYVSELSQSP
jgi:hypothetical protein